MVMCIQRKIFVMDWKIPPSSLKQNAIPAPRGFAPRVWNLHFAFVIRVEFFNPSLKFSLDSLNSCRTDQYHMVSKLCGIGQYHMFCKPHMFFTIFHWKTSWRFSKTWRIDQYHMFCKTCGIGQYHIFDEKSCFTMGYIVKSHKLYRNADPIQFKKLDWKIYNSSLE